MVTHRRNIPGKNIVCLPVKLNTISHYIRVVQNSPTVRETLGMTSNTTLLHIPEVDSAMESHYKILSFL